MTSSETKPRVIVTTDLEVDDMNSLIHLALYLNLLAMDHLGPYFEVGYGIGTFVFDMGLFLSWDKFDQIGFGYKLTFELFSK